MAEHFGTVTIDAFFGGGRVIANRKARVIVCIRTNLSQSVLRSAFVLPFGLLRKLILVCLAAPALAQEPTVKFGTTVVIPSGLKGVVYHIKPNSTKLPDLRKLKPKGTIYTSELNVPEQSFRKGFPGVTKRFEWFAIEYTGKFWISKPGRYRWLLTSDDGSQLYIDDQLVVNNDGIHGPADVSGTVVLGVGAHRIRVPYFQGPRDFVALVLRVSGPGPRQPLVVFSTDEFAPPKHPDGVEEKN